MKPDRSVSVVDDEESIREAIDALLRSVGFQVAAFASAEEFLGSEALGRTACLILDLRIPGMDGLQLQQRLRLDGHEVSIISLTANESADDRAQAMRAGAMAFLSKPPFDSDVLLATIEAARRRMAPGG